MRPQKAAVMSKLWKLGGGPERMGVCWAVTGSMWRGVRPDTDLTPSLILLLSVSLSLFSKTFIRQQLDLTQTPLVFFSNAPLPPLCSSLQILLISVKTNTYAHVHPHHCCRKSNGLHALQAIMASCLVHPSEWKKTPFEDNLYLIRSSQLNHYIYVDLLNCQAAVPSKPMFVFSSWKEINK